MVHMYRDQHWQTWRTFHENKYKEEAIMLVEKKHKQSAQGELENHYQAQIQ